VVTTVAAGLHRIRPLTSTSAAAVTTTALLTKVAGDTGAAGFDSTLNQRLSLPLNALKPTLDAGTFSVSLWVWKDAQVASIQGLFGGPDYPFCIYIDDDVLTFDVVVFNAGPIKYTVTRPFTDFAAWHHVYAYRNGTTGEIGLALDDGVRDTDPGSTDPIHLTTTAINVGARAITTQDLSGRIDELYFYSRVLTDAEVTALQTTELYA
jgi:hypothetical protein